MKRTASAVWQGTLKEGNGTLTAPSGVLKNTPYSFKSRFGDGGETNPEELVAAAHAGCFCMALSNMLATNGFTAERLATTANLNFEKVDDKFTITAVLLELTAKVPGIDQTKFMQLANDAKANCPISRALRADITLNAKLES